MVKKTEILNLVSCAILSLTFGCQTVHKKTETESVGRVYPVQSPMPPPVVPVQNNDSIEINSQIVAQGNVKSDLPAPTSPQQHSNRSVPKFGVILSGGGAKAWAHVGVLKELQKYKFPIVSIAGIEWGAVVAASYAHQASVNEVEWEMSKFKDIDDWQDFIKAAFVKKSTTDFKIPFVCPSLNLKNRTIYLLNRGQVDQFIPYCIPSEGLVKPYGNSVAYMNDLNLVVQHLKATGVTKIILINVIISKNDQPTLKSTDSVENQIWAQHIASLKKNVAYDDLIEIELNDFSIDDFDKRKDIMVKGGDLSYNLIKKLAEKYKL